MTTWRWDYCMPMTESESHIEDFLETAKKLINFGWREEQSLKDAVAGRAQRGMKPPGGRRHS